MKKHPLAILLAALLVCGSASAQYQWIDQDGRRVFSDVPPPASIPDKDILQMPSGSVPVTPTPAAEQADPESGAEEQTAAGGVDEALEAKKREAEEAEAKAKAEQEAVAQATREDNCKRAQSNKASFESGMRIARLNEKGERIVMDDAARAQELERADKAIADHCG